MFFYVLFCLFCLFLCISYSQCEIRSLFLSLGFRAYHEFIQRSADYYGGSEHLQDLSNFFGTHSSSPLEPVQATVITKQGKLIPCVYTYNTQVDEHGDFIASYKTYSPVLETKNEK
jgi:hypothetical protein